ncbi:MAG: HEAT repeat domain-containing protein, partial [SAR324 cluster bacterium]|nr:HEAT repeat domain-containing protein [SAR324 cluster bacterium]
MKNIRYQWKRYWVPYKNDGISLTDHGFLEDPTGEFGKYVSPNLATLEDLKKLGCLILVGEPGIGKSSEIKELYDATVNEAGDSHSLWIDLSRVGTFDYFIDRLTNDPRYKNWSENGEPLHLFLDSFDEGTFSFPRFANSFSALLADNQEKIPSLYLRISCRTALWPSYMESSLSVLWGEENCQTHELCPLTKKDVEMALDAQGIDKKAFLAEVQSKDVSGLAGKPLTLNFLMDVFLENKGHLPDRKSDIYSRGCGLLVQEPQEWKKVNPPKTPKLNLPQKIAVAERIAIATLIGGKPTIVIENEDKLLDNEVGITQLHGREIVDDVPVTLGDEEIKEVLNTGLFSARGNGKMGWAHQTYGEYLAARYIVRHQLPWKQIQSLLFQDPLKIGIFQVVPQLYEVGAWLASLELSFFDNAVLLDPEFLLLSDANVITDQQKQALVEKLLVRLDRGELVDRWETFNDTNYKKLNHPDIAAQLQPYIEDSSKDMVVRRAAIDIARACKVSSLEKLLVKIALDSNDNLSIRVHAALTVAHIGSDESKQALKPLADAGFPDDPEDELKGAVLRALWPNHISNQEAFSLITPPKKRSFHGAYYGFVDKEFAESLRTEDVLPGLSWIEANALTPERLEYFLGTLSDAIMLKAWEEIADPEVLEKFAQISYERLNEFAGIVGDRALSEKIAAKFQKALEEQDDGRRSLIKRLAQIIHEKDKKPGRKAFVLYHRSHVQLILPKDLEWFIRWLKSEKDEEMQKIIAEIIPSAFRVNDTSHIDLIYKARQRNSFLEEETRFWFEPVELASESAKEQRERWSDEKKWQEKREKKEQEEILKVLSPTRITELLEKSEAGDMDSWWRLNNAMCMYDHELDECKFEDLPGWKIIDEDIQKRIIEG